MTLDEAIEIKEKFRRERSQNLTPLEMEADKLSIEALEFCEKYKRMICQPYQTLLPGETKE